MHVRTILTALLILMMTPPDLARAMPTAEFAHPNLRAVMERLSRGEPTTLAFFGGSITWGASATDPLRTSWRARVEQTLRDRYSRTPLTAVDAAIGGQPSELGVFRMDRDVLPYEPDLVFVEFTVNDGSREHAGESLEGIIRKIQQRLPESAIVLVVFGYATEGSYDSPAREAHLAVGRHYGLPIVDAVPAIQQHLQAGLKTDAFLSDGVHPNDVGHQLYADVVMEQLDAHAKRSGPAEPTACSPRTANRYERSRMLELTTVADRTGWEAAQPSVVGTWFDHTPSRWHDSTLRAGEGPARLRVQLDGLVGLGLYYEMLPGGQSVIVTVNGAAHLQVDTANAFNFARVKHAFKWVEGSGPYDVTLTAADEGPAAVAYLLLVEPDTPSSRARCAPDEICCSK